MRRPFLLLLMVAVSFSACNSTLSLLVPAVVGNGAKLVNLSVTTFEGPGEIFFSIPPTIGIATQTSIENAAFYAFTKAQKACNILIKFDRESAGLIDGPSAGAATAVLIYAAITGEEIRNDTIITGSIEGGRIGSVGGVYEKAVAAAKNGFNYMITPIESVYERLLLKQIEEEYNITILETANIEELIEFMIHNKTIEKRPSKIVVESVDEELANYEEKIEGFDSVVESMIEEEKKALAQIEDKSIKEAFRQKIKNQKTLKEKGYLFSAANDAFLSYIDLLTVSAIEKNNINLPREKGAIGICLSRLKRATLTDKNFEWVVGAQVREQWASDRINVEIDENALRIEKFAMFNEIAYGKAWCAVAQSLYDSAPKEGRIINQKEWEKLAYKKLKEIEKFNIQGELLNRLKIAQNSYKKGYYGAAIFDAAYIKSALRAQAGETPQTTKFKYLWPKLYASHAAYLKEIGQEQTALRTLLFAEELENSFKEMEKEIPVKNRDFVVSIAALSVLITALTIAALRHRPK